MITLEGGTVYKCARQNDDLHVEAERNAAA